MKLLSQMQQSSTHLLQGHLAYFLSQLKEEQYQAPQALLEGNSIGKHVRHIIEFYQCLLEGLPEGRLNYDHRQRQIRLEEDVYFAQQAIEELITQIERVLENPSLLLETCFGEEQPLQVPTNWARELAYNIEHTVHHLAILRVLVQAQYPDIQLPFGFGIAYSTLQHQTAKSA
jgi:uncharacterized damage-inducible protein DinB